MIEHFAGSVGPAFERIIKDAQSRAAGVAALISPRTSASAHLTC